MYVCMYVCMLCMYVCMYVCMFWTFSHGLCALHHVQRHQDYNPNRRLSRMLETTQTPLVCIFLVFAKVHESGHELVPRVFTGFVEKGTMCPGPRIWPGTGPRHPHMLRGQRHTCLSPRICPGTGSWYCHTSFGQKQKLPESIGNWSQEYRVHKPKKTGILWDG